MRKIINSTYISLDGAVEQPHLWPTIERPSDERGGQIQTDLLLACDAVLMGRRTYEGFAPVWQTRSGDPYSDRINTMPKYVVSTTLKDPDWANTTVISSDVAERVRELKAEPGQDNMRATLAQGWNEILVKVDNAGGNKWGFYLELRDPNTSKPITGIEIKGAPP